MNQIPEELRALRRWHNWRNEKGVKVPIQVNGHYAKSNDPSTWTDFETAKKSGQLAFELGVGYCGVDLDNCLDEFGELREWAKPVVERFLGVAYMEISPSGNGIKFTTKASKPEGSLCLHKIGDNKQQIECYDGGRMWTTTGNVYQFQLTIGDGQEAVEWLCENYLKAEVPEIRKVIVSSVSSPLTDRAMDYLDNVSQARPGNRNNAAFSLAGHLGAMVDDAGFRLSHEQVVDFVSVWNSRNPDPLPDFELQRAVKSALRNGTPREAKLPQIVVKQEDYSDVDLSGIIGSAKNVTKKKNEEESISFDLVSVPGLIGDLVDYNLRTAHYPLPELALAGAVSLMSTVLAGKVEFGGARSNLYVMGLAPSGGGKDYSRKLNRKILRAAGHPEVCGPERIGSHAGVISALAENWRTLFQIDEIGRMLATASNASTNPHLFNITTVLMQVYSSADDVWQGDAYGDRKKVKTLYYPHCVVYGSSVPEGFWESISKDNLTNGLIGRFLIFENPRYVDYQVPEVLDFPESIVNQARGWLDLRTHGGNLSGSTEADGAHARPVYADEEASERLHNHAIEISKKRKEEDHVQAAIWSRHAEKTNKLALLFACSRWSDGKPWPTIRIEDADRAIKLNNWLTRRMLLRSGLWVSENQTEKDTLKVLRTIQERPGISSTELARSLRWLKARDRRDILNGLIESGDIVCEQVDSGGGRHRIEYRPT